MIFYVYRRSLLVFPIALTDHPLSVPGNNLINIVIYLSYVEKYLVVLTNVYSHINTNSECSLKVTERYKKIIKRILIYTHQEF